MSGTRDVASNWERDWQGHVKNWGYQLELSSKILFRQERHQVSGMTHGDDCVLTGQTERLTEFGNTMTGVYPIKAKLIRYGSTESIKVLTRRLHWGKWGIVYQHDPRHVDVLVEDFGLEQGNSVQTPATPDATEEEPEPLDQVQHRSSRHDVHRERVVSKKVKTHAEPCQVGVWSERQWDKCSEMWKEGRRSDNMFSFRLGRLQRNSKIIKRRLDTAREPHPESTHAQAKDHCNRQCGGRAVCGSIGSVPVERNCVVVEGSWPRDEASASHRCEGHRTHSPQTRNWQIEAH